MRYAWVALDAAGAEPGRLRSRSVARQPTPDGTVRIVEMPGSIASVRRDARGSTAQSVRADLKIDNKGRHNRRVKFGLVDARAEGGSPWPPRSSS